VLFWGMARERLLTRKEIQQRYRERHPERVAAGKKRWAKNNPSYHQKWAAEKRAADPLYFKRVKWRNRYGAVPPRMAGARCDCCARKYTAMRSVKAKYPCLDHDHTTGKFRGWVCDDCNLAIGRAGDTLEGVRRLVSYMERVSCQTK
jgi:hypothetical protein